MSFFIAFNVNLNDYFIDAMPHDLIFLKCQMSNDMCHVWGSSHLDMSHYIYCLQVWLLTIDYSSIKMTYLTKH
jgi:hypothetical protein